MHQENNVSPAEALQILIEGNKRFVAENSIHPNTDKNRRNEVLNCQIPFAVILSCSDSRVPPEVIFDRGIGDLFVIRVAGNIYSSVVKASIMLAVKHLECPLVVVMGHSSCSAVSMCFEKSEIFTEESHYIKKIIKMIRSNIPEALSMISDKDKKIEFAIKENVKSIAANLSKEKLIVSRIAKGKTIIKPALYSNESGKVSWL